MKFLEAKKAEEKKNCFRPLEKIELFEIVHEGKKALAKRTEQGSSIVWEYAGEWAFFRNGYWVPSYTETFFLEEMYQEYHLDYCEKNVLIHGINLG